MWFIDRLRDSWLYVEPVPEDIAKDQVLVVRTEQIDEETLETVTFGGYAFVCSEVLF